MIDHPSAFIKVFLSFSSCIRILINCLLRRNAISWHSRLRISLLLVLGLLINRLLIRRLSGIRLGIWLLDRLNGLLNRLLILLYWLNGLRGLLVLLDRLLIRLYRSLILRCLNQCNRHLLRNLLRSLLKYRLGLNLRFNLMWLDIRSSRVA